MASKPAKLNGALRELLTEARWTHTQFAQAVNRTGAETGQLLRYDGTAISHWLTGTRPPRCLGSPLAPARPTPQLACRARSRRELQVGPGHLLEAGGRGLARSGILPVRCRIPASFRHFSGFRVTPRHALSRLEPQVSGIPGL
ncbi:hypothetical protein GCM10010417_26680 [Streptomyces carpaticus]